MPAKENGVQSSTISYSNVVIPEGITKNPMKHYQHNLSRTVMYTRLDKLGMYLRTILVAL